MTEPKEGTGRTRYDIRGTLVVWVGSPGVLDQEEWSIYLNTLVETARRERAALRVLVFPEAAVPSAAQRRQLLEASRNAGARTAVITDGLVERGVTMALRWMKIDIKAFTTTAVAEAFKFLEADAEERAWAEVAVRRLRGELGMTSVRPPASYSA